MMFIVWLLKTSISIISVEKSIQKDHMRIHHENVKTKEEKDLQVVNFYETPLVNIHQLYDRTFYKHCEEPTIIENQREDKSPYYYVQSRYVKEIDDKENKKYKESDTIRFTAIESNLTISDFFCLKLIYKRHETPNQKSLLQVGFYIHRFDTGARKTKIFRTPNDSPAFPLKPKEIHIDDDFKIILKKQIITFKGILELTSIECFRVVSEDLYINVEEKSISIKTNLVI